MPPDPTQIAKLISGECGLAFQGQSGKDRDGKPWIELIPAGFQAQQTFRIRTTIGWRSLEIVFRPGTFAAELVTEMAKTGVEDRAVFSSVIVHCLSDGASVALEINNQTADPLRPELWPQPWSKFEFILRRGQLDINTGDANLDLEHVRIWTGRVAAAVLALLPLEDILPEQLDPTVSGLPEGARIRVEANRYERSRRNRAAAIAIHGTRCMACQKHLEEIYGTIASGFIEIHHVTPVSKLGAGYIIDLAKDLMPLCPNCHGIAHRRDPPFTIDEIRIMLAGANPQSINKTVG